AFRVKGALRESTYARQAISSSRAMDESSARNSGSMKAARNRMPNSARSSWAGAWPLRISIMSHQPQVVSCARKSQTCMAVESVRPLTLHGSGHAGHAHHDHDNEPQADRHGSCAKLADPLQAWARACG